MARDHGRVLCKIWHDKEFRALSRSAQALYMQLLSQPNVNNAGVLPLMLSKWAKGCDDIGSAGLTRDLAELVEARFIVVDTDTEEVLIRSFIRNDGGMKHPYIFKNALKMAEAVESERIRAALAVELRRIRRGDALRVADLLDPSASEPEPVTTAFASVPNDEVIPSESHSNHITNGSESDIPFESHPDHCGEGEGEGVGETPVAGYVGGSRAHTCEARTREGNPNPQNSPQANESDDALPSRFCPRHPVGTPDACRDCATARERHDLAVTERADRRRVAANHKRDEIRHCDLCDDAGWRTPPAELRDADPPVARCTHEPAMPATWRALIADALADAQEKTDA